MGVLTKKSIRCEIKCFSDYRILFETQRTQRRGKGRKGLFVKFF